MHKSFYDRDEWLRLRYRVLEKVGGRCEACGRSKKDGAIIQVDHIKPKSIYPELALSENNLQVLCRDCNVGKSNKSDKDWRQKARGVECDHLSFGAIMMLLSDPSLAVDCDTAGLNLPEPCIFLVDIINLIKERPAITAPQIAGYWYGEERGAVINTLLRKLDGGEMLQTKEDLKGSFRENINRLHMISNSSTYTLPALEADREESEK